VKRDILLAGVGGQGILSIAAVIGVASVESGLYLKQAEVHGMSQRGGAVQSHVRISDSPIASDLIEEGKCDLILSVEPMEALRYLPFLSKEGWVITSSRKVKNMEDYPAEKELMEAVKKVKNNLIIEASDIAKKLGSQKVSNMVMLGAASKFISLSQESLNGAVAALFGSKGEEMVGLNISALHAGRDAQGSR